MSKGGESGEGGTWGQGRKRWGQGAVVIFCDLAADAKSTFFIESIWGSMDPDEASIWPNERIYSLTERFLVF